jgi:hypothetical protein
MPTVKTVQVTIATTPGPANASISIQVSEDPVMLHGHGHGNGAFVHWDIQTAGWVFVSSGDGVAITKAGNRFRHIGDGNLGTRHTWQRDTIDGLTYKYTIAVTDGNVTLTWDPSIVNK